MRQHLVNSNSEYVKSEDIDYTVLDPASLAHWVEFLWK